MIENTTKVFELIKNYGLQPNSYYEYGDNPYQLRQKEVQSIIDNWPEKGYPPADEFLPIKYKALKLKWESYIGEGYYGFSIDPPCPEIWYDVVDDFLSYVREECPKFRISQIKIKYGGLKIYLVGIDDNIKLEIEELEKVLFDEKLKR